MKQAKSDARDWVDPDFFNGRAVADRGFWKFVLRQIIPARGQSTHLTVSGLMLITIALGVGVTAYNSGSNILFLSLSLVLSTLILSGVLSVINFRKVTWRLVLPSELRAGSLASARLYVQNRKRLFPTFGIWFNTKAGERAPRVRLQIEEPLPTHGEVELEWRFRPERRGPLLLELSGVESKYPFGFIRKTLGGVRRHTAWVWPQRVDYYFRPARGEKYLVSGELLEKAGRGDDLVKVRGYVPGDPLRMIHWKATARVGRLQVREVAEEVESAYYLQLETGKALWRDEAIFERFCSTALSLAEDFFHQNRLLGYAVNNDAPVQIRTMSDLHGFFDVLSRLEMSADIKRSGRSYGQEWIGFQPSKEGGILIHAGEHPAGQVVA